MTRREYVKAAIEHRATDRVPYYIRFCGDAWESLKELVGDASLWEFIDDDVLAFGPPWWRWYELEGDWRGMDAPNSRAKVTGTGSYTEFVDRVKAAREKTDKYILILISTLAF